MNCNSKIHKEIKTMGEISCPFCSCELQDKTVKNELCCVNVDIVNDNGKNVCRSCGSVHYHDFIGEYIDFYENKFKFTRKSVYHRNYHIFNRIDFIMSKNNIQITHSDQEKIIRIFNEIEKILNQINGKRKRMISIDFVLQKLFKMMNYLEMDIPLSKSKRTLASYELYWGKVQLLIGDKIEFIINSR